MKPGGSPNRALRQRALALADRLRLKPRIIRIQEMRRKWGSCSSTGAVTLARDLADVKPDFQYFVILHELLHLRVPKHGRLFRALMASYVPGWRQHDAERRPCLCSNSRRPRSPG